MTRPITALPLITGWQRRNGARYTPFPVNTETVVLCYNGRAAIWQGAQVIGLKEGDRVLAPAYCCGSEVAALLKAGLKIEFYSVQPDLSPNFDSLRALCRKRAQAFLVTHYFGFPQPMDSILEFAMEHGLLVIEDNAHGLYSRDQYGRHLGSMGAIGIFSFRKTLPLPDGGAFVVDRAGSLGRASPESRSPGILSVAGSVKGLLEQAAGSRFPIATRYVKSLALDPFTRLLKRAAGMREPTKDSDVSRAMAPADLEAEHVTWRMSRGARFLLRSMDHTAIPDRRRRNFQGLLDQFEGGPRVVPLFTRLPRGCCPMCFPVRAESPADLQRFLNAHGIQGKSFWPFFHHILPIADFPFESLLKRSVLVLPVHQDLGSEEIAYMGGLLNEWNATAAKS